MMRRILVLISVLTLMVVIVPVASAAPAGVSITGGGISDDAFPNDAVRYAGFNAHETDGTYKGQVQLKSVTDTGTTLSRIHGTVVCIQKTTAVGGGSPAEQGWEIRFHVTKAVGLGVPFEGKYHSIYVQDRSEAEGGDQIDEGDDFGFKTIEDCGGRDHLVVWEPVLRGDIKVRS